MMWGLNKNQKEHGVLNLDLNYICEYYRDWILSAPFDIGQTTRDALGALVLPENNSNLVETAKQRANDYNYDSCSNSCIMRSTPMAIWAANLTDDDFKKACRSEVELTHTN
jgi:ADP-ribosylglycohydrolase